MAIFLVFYPKIQDLAMIFSQYFEKNYSGISVLRVIGGSDQKVHVLIALENGTQKGRGDAPHPPFDKIHAFDSTGRLHSAILSTIML